MISIKICFSNKEVQFDFLSDFQQEYLREKHCFSLNENALMRDLLLSILEEFDPESSLLWDDGYLYRRFTGMINGSERDINLDFPVKDFYSANEQSGYIILNYQIGIRGGWGQNITAEISIHIPSSEKGHERIPHVHVRKGSYQQGDPYSNTVRVNLVDLSVMDNANRKAKKLFGKKWDYVLRVIRNNRDQLLKQYNDMLCGALPEKISLNLEDETESVIPNIFRY